MTLGLVFTTKKNNFVFLLTEVSRLSGMNENIHYLQQKYSKTYFGTFCFNFCVRALHPTFCQSSHWSFSFGKNLRSDQRLLDNACSFCSLLVTCNRSPLKVFQHTHDVHLFKKNMVKTIE